MKKISVITVLNTINYGSALQTFATQKYLEDLGMEVEFIDYWRPDQRAGARARRVLLDKKSSLKQWIKKPVRDVLELVSIWKSTKMFRGFLQKNIHLTSANYASIHDLVENPPDADIYATGSDQMWNSGWNQGIEKSFVLTFVPENKKKISFSTSIGKTAWDKWEAEKVVPLLQKYDYITLREQSAVDLLDRYGIAGTLVLDPTLLFDRNQWNNYLPQKKQKERYLLVYQLHQTHAQANFTKAVKAFALKKGLAIKRVTYSFSDRLPGQKIVLPEVFTFLQLIRDADFIITDSFHGTAFSVNFNKQFAVLYPEHFSTRMDNLLTMTGLNSRRFTDSSNLETFDAQIDYNQINQILKAKRAKIKKDFKAYFAALEGKEQTGEHL